MYRIMTMSKSKNAIKANLLLTKLQSRFVNKLNYLSDLIGEKKYFERITWFRDAGLHGGGSRFEARDNILFNTASVNVSQVHYDDMPEKSLSSATAISTIIHPNNPNVPSIHIHISLTEFRDGTFYWRLMADLNPSINIKKDERIFTKKLKDLSGNKFDEAKQQGDKYFNIPVLNRTRGISHFYLENYNTGDEEADFEFANRFGEDVIDIYIDIIKNAFISRTKFSVQNIQEQLAYHTLYLFQVLTLDRGTTAGLLVHNQNDTGIMGSLPSFINKKLLSSWVEKMQKPQDELLISIINCIDDNGVINEEVKLKLANAVREHYIKNKDALNLQASGNTIPQTISNHNK